MDALSLTVVICREEVGWGASTFPMMEPEFLYFAPTYSALKAGLADALAAHLGHAVAFKILNEPNAEDRD